MTAELIKFDKKHKVFNLSNNKITYLLSIEEGNTLCHLYFGKRLRNYHGELTYPKISRAFSSNLPGSDDKTFSRDTLPKEYSSTGEGDFRIPAASVKNIDGSNALFLTYKEYKIEAGKPKMAGLPASFVNNDNEAETLTIILEDKTSKLEFDLIYTIFSNCSVIARSVKVRNLNDDPIHLTKISSMQLDLVDKANVEVLTLPGSHVHERQITRRTLDQGIHTYASNRGTSSPQMNPFIALVDKNTTEFSGEAYGFNLVYSGNHKSEIEKDQIDQLRLNVGINDFDFDWKLATNDEFQTPEVLLTYSDGGLNGMSQILHHFIQEHIVRSKYKDQLRPILINNWEATYFNFDEQKLKSLIDEASDLGMELFVLDDGWFGHRDNDRSSLGDWKVYDKKLPHGLNGLIDYVHQKQMKFGLWFEPEMISYDSDLYREHPDYLMHVPGREPSPSRRQFILDLGRKEVRDNIFKQIDHILSEYEIDYVKWDMNRHLTDIYEADLPADQQGEVYHRYVLGLYDLLDRITSKYSNILFESCSSGGGRFDLGMAYYMPQVWTSDNTDAIDRLYIQYGTSLVYPINMMGAHVSISPNEQNGRITPLNTRFAVAMSGDLGYELDLTKLTDEEKDEIRQQVEEYKKLRQLIQQGSFYRLKSPFDSNQTAWNFVSKDRKEVVLMTFHIMSRAQKVFSRTKLYGLDPDLDYKDLKTGEIFGGDELMDVGLYDKICHRDFEATIRHFKAVE